MWLTTTISTATDSLGRLIQKVRRLGKQDIQTAPVIAPYGFDSNPIKDMVAVYAETAVKGDTVIIGYLNKNSIAAVGGVRLFSTDTEGAEQFYVYLKPNNILELGGAARHLARFEELETAFNELMSKFNAHTHLSTATGTPTGPVIGPSSADIAACKITDIKVK
mgnify:CR=1 FL=1